MSASIDSFRTISFTFEAICGEYLNRTRTLRASSMSFAPGINWPRGHVSIYPDVSIYRTSSVAGPIYLKYSDRESVCVHVHQPSPPTAFLFQIHSS